MNPAPTPEKMLSLEAGGAEIAEGLEPRLVDEGRARLGEAEVTAGGDAVVHDRAELLDGVAGVRGHAELDDAFLLGRGDTCRAEILIQRSPQDRPFPMPRPAGY